MGFYEGSSALINWVHHGRGGPNAVRGFIGLPQRSREQDAAKTFALPGCRDSEPAEQCCTYEPVARNVLAPGFRYNPLLKRGGTQRETSEDGSRGVYYHQEEERVRLAADVLRRLCLQVAVEALHPAGEAVAVVRCVQRLNVEVSGGVFRDLERDAAALRFECRPQALIRRGWIDHHVKERRPLSFVSASIS